MTGDVKPTDKSARAKVISTKDFSENLVKNGLSKGDAENFVSKYFVEYVRIATFKAVSEGTYDVQVRACICTDALPTTPDGSYMKIEVSVGGVSAGTAKFFKITANPGEPTDKNAPKAVSLGYYENIVVKATSDVTVSVRVMDTSYKSVFNMEIADDTTVGFTLSYVE